VEKGSIPRMPQPHQQATYAPMLDKSIAKIDWAKPAIEIKNLVRGLNPWPVAFTYYKGRIMKIWSVDIVKNCTDGVPGIILKHIKGQGLAVKAGDNNCIIIEEVQFEGGKRMKVDEYLRGHSIEFGECLG
jgi:methionyl-tRNA formyltransferase